MVANVAPVTMFEESKLSDDNLIAFNRRCMSVRTQKESLEDNQKTRDLISYRRLLRLEEKGLKTFSVSFGTVKIREHGIILGDNPAVSSGAPITIDWDYFDEDLFDLDEYESTRPDRRSYSEMSIPERYRFDILKRCEFTTKEIIEQAREAEALRLQRAETSNQLYRAQSHEKVEKLQRGFINMFTNKKKKERQLLKKSKSILDAERAQHHSEIMLENESLDVSMHSRCMDLSQHSSHRFALDSDAVNQVKAAATEGRTLIDLGKTPN